MPLYIAQSGDLDMCYRCLTDSLTTLKDRATQLLKKYKSGALVTQFNSFWQWEGFPLFSLPLILIHNWKKGKVTKYAVTLFRCLVTTLSNFIHNPQSARRFNTSNINGKCFKANVKHYHNFDNIHLLSESCILISWSILQVNDDDDDRNLKAY